MESERVNYRVDERAPPKLAIRLKNYLWKGGDPKNLPWSLMRVFEPCAGGFFSLRPHPLRPDEKSRYMKTPLIENIFRRGNRKLTIGSIDTFQANAEVVRGLLSEVDELDPFDLTNSKLEGKSLDVAIKIIEALFTLYPGKLITLEIDDHGNRDWPCGASCSVKVLKDVGNEFVLSVSLESDKVVFPVWRMHGKGLSGLEYQHFPDGVVDKLKELISPYR